MMEGRDMCDYCEKHHFLAVNDVTNSRGVTTEIGISIIQAQSTLRKDTRKHCRLFNRECLRIRI